MPESSSFPGVGLKLPGSESDPTCSEKFKDALRLPHSPISLHITHTDRQTY
jgi:hypothetical protein